MRPDAKPAQQRIADLQSVLEVSRDLASAAELPPLLAKVEASARQVLNCERATVFLYDKASHELVSRLATGVQEIRFSADLGIAGEVFRTGRLDTVRDAYADPRFNPEIDRKTGFRTRNLITVPLRGFDNSIVGVLQLLNKADGFFDAWDEELVSTFAAQVGVAVQRQRLLEEYARKQQIQRDLCIARSIQESLLPKEPPRLPGFEVAGWSRPAEETGGDCFDYFPLDENTLAITVADATGHGIGPALMIAECRALFRAIAGVSRDLAPIVGRINNLLWQDLLDDRFVTAFFGILDVRDSTLSYLSAGHGPLFTYRRAADEIAELGANAVPLGIMPDIDFDGPDRFVMSPGDMMVLVTDGLFEWANPAGEQFGTRRLGDVVRSCRDCPCEEMIRRLHHAVLDFAAGTPQNDDLTAVIIKKTPAAS